MAKSEKKHEPAIVRYCSGPKKGLPKFCECGGKIAYDRDFGRWFSVCLACSPVVRINLAQLRADAAARSDRNHEGKR